MLISVVVPIYKVEKYLCRCIDSILNQTFNDFELILVDDGSPDNCGKMCDEYAKADNRITVIHRKNGGLSSARNSGIEWALNNSNSEWITFIDSDDWVHPDYLKILLDGAKEFNSEVVVCNFLRTQDCLLSSVLIEKLNLHKYDPEDFFVNYNLNAVVAWGKLYKKFFFKYIRYPEGKLHEDEFTTYKILFQCDFICFIDENLYYYFINPQGITLGMVGGEWSPSKIDFLYALEERITYFKRKKLNNMWKWQIGQYFGSICSYLKFLTSISNSSSNKIYLKHLKKSLRRFLKNRKAKAILKISIKNYPEIYEFIYPNFMKVYWKLKKSL